MESAERKASTFFRRLVSAECLSEAAIRLGFFRANTPGARSSALLCLVTSADHFRGAVFAIVPSAICTFRKKSCPSAKSEGPGETASDHKTRACVPTFPGRTGPCACLQTINRTFCRLACFPVGTAVAQPSGGAGKSAWRGWGGCRCVEQWDQAMDGGRGSKSERPSPHST
jgi:hypothetical protein